MDEECKKVDAPRCRTVQSLEKEVYGSAGVLVRLAKIEQRLKLIGRVVWGGMITILGFIVEIVRNLIAKGADLWQ